MVHERKMRGEESRAASPCVCAAAAVRDIACVATVRRDRSGSLSSSQIIEVLESVKCKCELDDKLHLLADLHRLVKKDPAMCEEFFVPQPRPSAHDAVGRSDALAGAAYTAWTAATQIIEQFEEGDPAAAKITGSILPVLCAVSAQVGIGVENLRGLLGMMINTGYWAPASLCILNALHAMVLSEGPAGQIGEQASASVDTPERPPTSAGLIGAGGGRGGARAAPRRRGKDKVFVFDGAQSGLFLGSFPAWPFDAGYAFETWVWPDSSVHGSGRLLLRILASDGDAASAAGRAAHTSRPVVEIVLHAETIIIITSQAGSKRSPLKCHVTIPSQQGVHIAVSHRKGGLLSRAECDVCVNGHFSSYVLPFPKVANGAAAVQVLVGCAQMDPSIEQPHLFWEKASLTLKPFKGLMATTRFFTSPLTVNDMRALYAASCAGPAACDLSHEARLLAQPHLAFPSLPASSLLSPETLAAPGNAPAQSLNPNPYNLQHAGWCTS